MKVRLETRRTGSSTRWSWLNRGSRRNLALVVVLVAVVLASTPSTAGAQVEQDPLDADSSQSGPGRVLIISAPRLTWQSVEQVAPPHLMELFSQSALASTSVRAAASVTRPADGYLTIGAGNRMAAPASISGGATVEVGELFGDRIPSELFQRTTGVTPTKPILSLDKPQLDRFNEDNYHFGASSGSLAHALNESGRTMSVLGNTDIAMVDSYLRQVGLAAMGRDGQVDDGAVGRQLLRFNAEAAWGLELDHDVYLRVFQRMWAQHDVVLAELSDLERAETARSDSTLEQGAAQYERALRSSDDLVGAMLADVDLDRDTVIVVSPTAPFEELQLTVFAMAGPGIDAGWAKSATTRRARFVTLTDIAPTVLAHFDVPAPSEMNDTRISAVVASTTPGERIDTMIDDSAEAVLRDRTFGPISVVFVVALVITIVLATLALARVPRLAPLLRGITLVELAFLPTTFLLGLFAIRTATGIGVGLIVGSVGFAFAAALLKRVDSTMPALALVGLLWLVLALDIATGGRLQINTTFGYSPIVAGRFAGFGNQAYSMIAVSALLLAAGFADRRRPDAEGRATVATSAAIGVWMLVTLVLDGHPSMGSDVGGVLAIVPATAVLLLMIRRVKIRARLVAMIGLGTIAVLALFAGLDLGRPPESRTHLGRFASDLFNGEAGQIIQRKLAANLRVLTSVWAWVIPAALIYFCYLTWRPNRTFSRLMERSPNYRAFGVSALTLGFLSAALNDSGVSLPAIMLAIVSAYTIYLVTELEFSDVREPAMIETVSAESAARVARVAAAEEPSSDHDMAGEQ